MNTLAAEDMLPNRPRRLVRIFRVAIFSAVAVATAVALFYAEENWRGERAWATHVKAMAALGEHLDLASFTLAPVPDDQNFAKTPVLDTLAYQPKSPAVESLAEFLNTDYITHVRSQWDQGRSFDWQGWLEGLPATVRSEPLSKGLSPTAQALAILKPLEPAMAELRTAARMRPLGQFRSPKPPDNSFYSPSAFGPFKLSKLLGPYVAAELAEGKTDQAFEDTLVLQRLASAIETDLETDHALVDAVVCNILHGSYVLQIFWDGWQQSSWTPAHYEAFQAQFGAWDGPAAHNRALREGRALVNQIFNVDRIGTYRDLEELRRWRFVLMPRGWYRQNLIAYNLAIQQVLANGFDERPPQYRQVQDARLKAHFKELRESHSPFLWLVEISTTNLDKLGPGFARNANRISMAGVVCALERYKAERGEYPERLEVLVPKFAAALPTDLYTGQPFRYHRTADGQFLLYSVGPDEKDDGGVKGDDWAWPARSIPQVGPAHDDESPQKGLNARERYQSEIDGRRRLRAGAVQGQAR